MGNELKTICCLLDDQYVDKDAPHFEVIGATMQEYGWNLSIRRIPRVKEQEDQEVKNDTE